MSRSHDDELQSLEQGPYTFTSQQVKDQLYRDRYVHDVSSNQGYPPTMKCEFIHYTYVSGVLHSYSEKQKSEVRNDFCRDLFDAVRDPVLHLQGLDEVLARVVHCNFQFSDEDEAPVIKACRLLSRLPAICLELPHDPADLNPGYFIPERFDSESPSWRHLKLASVIPINVIRIALVASSYQQKAIGVIHDLLNDIADLLSSASALSASATCDRERDSWFLVRAFLWVTWQRGSMLYLHQRCKMHLKFGFNDHNSEERTLRGFSPAPGMSIQEMSKRIAAKGKAAYMCGWAFEILRTDPVGIGCDFRRFHSHFAAAFGDRRGRCSSLHGESCDGGDYGNCQRSRGIVTEDQSAHDTACCGSCVKLFWNETSYRSFSGARGVKLENNPAEGKLTYCQASNQTLAVTHVWSHGQGGRVDSEQGPLPDVTGFNNCLHNRYCALAKSLGCDSYWMDTPCIPEVYGLRQEAIENINRTFEHSKVTLVCDKDLMAIDISELSVQKCELILITLIVCDWDTRAWTFLESFRGRGKIFLLCRKNATLSFKEVVDTVYQQGSLEVAMLLSTIPHALPPDIQGTKDWRQLALEHPNFEPGFMRLEPSGSLLCHRTASRNGDDIVIWSLLLGDKIFKDAELFWKSRIGKGLSTSFLISSAPRLKAKGLRWAPASPIANTQDKEVNGPTKRLLAFDGVESEIGTIEENGFRAPWLFFTFTGGQMGSNILPSVLDTITKPKQAHCPNNLRQIRRKFLRNYRWGILLRPVRSGAGEGFGRRNSPAVNRSDLSKTLVAICATNHLWEFNPRRKSDWVRWVWRGVYEWDDVEPVPHCTSGEILVT